MDDVFRLVTFCVEFFLFSAQFILVLISEPKSQIARSENVSVFIERLFNHF